jgi:hypothetical protein
VRARRRYARTLPLPQQMHKEKIKKKYKKNVRAPSLRSHAAAATADAQKKIKKIKKIQSHSRRTKKKVKKIQKNVRAPSLRSHAAAAAQKKKKPDILSQR